MPHLSIVVFRYRSSYSSVEIGLLNRNPCARPTPQERRVENCSSVSIPSATISIPSLVQISEMDSTTAFVFGLLEILSIMLLSSFSTSNSTSDKRARFAYSVPKSSMATVKPAWRSFDIRYLISRPSMSCTRSVTSICIYLGDIW